MRKALALLTSALMLVSLLAGCGAASAKPSNSSDAAASDTADAGSDAEAEAPAAEGEDPYADVTPEVTLTMSHQMAASHSINATSEEFARLVREKSEGKMAVDVYPAATLGTETENLQALDNGTLDVAIVAAEFYANYVDEAGILCLPFMYDSYDDAYDKLHSEAGDKIADMILQSTNARVLDWYVLAFRQIFTTDKEINSIDDLAGLIIRIPDSNTYSTTFSQLGAAPARSHGKPCS